MADVKKWTDRYVYICEIGVGSFSTAYKVKDIYLPKLHENPGIKVLKEIRLHSKDWDEITQEGELLSKLSFPGIIKFFDSFIYQGLYCIVTEFCEGGDLSKVVATTKKDKNILEENKVIKWFTQIMLGLAYIHKRRIIHRDIKTNNIFLKNDCVKIGDFGICRILKFTLDMADTFAGTYLYMSPEVLNGQKYNEKSDIWSAGVVLHELCSLKCAYKGFGISTTLDMIVKGPCPRIPTFYCIELQNTLERIMIKDPADRPSAAQIIQMKFLQDNINNPNVMDKYLDVGDLNTKSQTQETPIINPLKTNKKIEFDKIIFQTKKLDFTNQSDQEKKENELKINSAETTENEVLETINIATKKLYFKNQSDQQMRKNRKGLSNTFGGDIKQIIHPKEQSTLIPGTSQKSVILKSFDENYTMKVEKVNNTQNFASKSMDLGKNWSFNTERNIPDLLPIRTAWVLTEFQHVPEHQASNIAPESKNPNLMINKCDDDKNNDKKNKENHMKSIESQCLEHMSERELSMALRFLDQSFDDSDCKTTLGKMVKSDQVAMLVEKLHFLRKDLSSKTF